MLDWKKLYVDINSGPPANGNLFIIESFFYFMYVYRNLRCSRDFAKSSRRQCNDGCGITDTKRSETKPSVTEHA